RRAAAHRADALVAQAEHAAGLRAGRDLDRGLPLERRHLDAAAERRDDEADRHFAGEVRAVALEDRVFAHRDLDVEIAGRPAVPARFALAREADSVARVDAPRHLHGKPLRRSRSALPRALRAGVRDDRAATLAARAGLLHGKNALGNAHLAAALAGLAGDGCVPARGAAAAALRALSHGLVVDLLVRA